jgi:DNA-directed RNA polymerase subunit M/transcription elongation factor TFIIS
MEDWDSLYDFFRIRLIEIGINNDYIEALVDTLNEKYYDNWTLQDCFASCSEKITQLLNGLDPTSSVGREELRNDVTSGKITPEELISMSHIEMCPDVWKDDVKEIDLRENVVYNEEWTEEYECEKCHQRKQQVTLVQLRSADEGQTAIIICKCGHRWMFHN